MIGIYLRVSTKEQEEGNQLAPLVKWCEAREMKFRVYQEKVSGKSTKGREELEKMMKGVESGHLEGVLVWSLDRFGRSLPDLIALLNRILGMEARFVSYVNGFDIRKADPASMLTFQIFGAIAEFERAMISERTKLGLERARKEGKKLGRKNRMVDEVEVIKAVESGVGWKAVMERFGVSRWLLAKIVKKWKGEDDEG